jgi:hypothetical protein
MVVCTHLSVNFFVTLRSNIWNTIVEPFLKHTELPMEVTMNRNYPR